MELAEFILAVLAMASIPSAIVAFLFRRSEKKMEQREAKREEREKKIEKMFILNAQAGRATYIIAKATAVAVQRNPDFHCNGDMTSALEQSEKVQKEYQEFLMDNGVQHVFHE